MKLKEQIFKEDSETLINCDIYYNEELTKGLYLVGFDKYIKSNVKKLNIEYQIPDIKEQIGVRFTKQNNFVIVTIVILDEINGNLKIQFILKENCSAELIYSCKNIVLEGLRETLIDGLQMMYANTLQDIMDLSKDKG